MTIRPGFDKTDRENARPGRAVDHRNHYRSSPQLGRLDSGAAP
jgi:hypothetical protein